MLWVQTQSSRAGEALPVVQSSPLYGQMDTLLGCTEPPGWLNVSKCLPLRTDKLQSKEALYVFSGVLWETHNQLVVFVPPASRAS